MTSMMSGYRKVQTTDNHNESEATTTSSQERPGLEVVELFQDEIQQVAEICDVNECHESQQSVDSHVDSDDSYDTNNENGNDFNSNLPLHLQNQPRITWFDASMHLIKGNLGPGCLNLPHAFAQCGWLMGTVLFSIVALQGVYSMMLLAECKQLLCNAANHRPVFTFMDVAQQSLGSKGHAFVQVFLFILQAGVCCVFLSLMATNMQAQTTLTVNECMVLITGALLLISLVRYMKDLRWLSTTANLFMLTAIGTAAITATSEIIHKDLPMLPKGTSDLGNIATFISSMFFAFEGIGLVLPVENTFTVSNLPEEVHDANQFYRTGVLPGSMSIVGILFWIIGFSASWGFPHIDSGSITAHLAEQFPDQPWFKVVNSIVMVAVFFTFPLQLAPALEVMEGWLTPDSLTSSLPVDTNDPDDSFPQEAPLHESESHPTVLSVPDVDTDHCSSKTCWQNYEWIILRYAIIFGCLIVVLVVDDLGTLMALFGAVGQTGLAMMPCLCHLALQKHGIAPKNQLKTVMNILIILFSTLVMVFGLVASIGRMFHRYW